MRKSTVASIADAAFKAFPEADETVRDVNWFDEKGNFAMKKGIN